MESKVLGLLVVAACLLAAIPWRLAIGGTDMAFLVFALAPPLLLASGIGLREWSQVDRHRA